MPGLLNNLWNEGKLPVVETSVSIDKESIDYMAIVAVLVVVIAVAISQIAKRV